MYYRLAMGWDYPKRLYSRRSCFRALCIPVAPSTRSGRSSLVFHNVASTRSGRTAGLHRRPSPRQERRARELLSHLQIMGFAHPEAPIRRHHIPHPRKRTVMENNIFESFHLSCTLHQISTRSMSSGCHSRGCRRGWMDLDLFLRRTFCGGYRRTR